jgi:hypothetical protein
VVSNARFRSDRCGRAKSLIICPRDLTFIRIGPFYVRTSCLSERWMRLAVQAKHGMAFHIRMNLSSPQKAMSFARMIFAGAPTADRRPPTRGRAYRIAPGFAKWIFDTKCAVTVCELQCSVGLMIGREPDLIGSADRGPDYAHDKLPLAR